MEKSMEEFVKEKIRKVVEALGPDASTDDILKMLWSELQEEFSLRTNDVENWITEAVEKARQADPANTVGIKSGPPSDFARIHSAILKRTNPFADQASKAPEKVDVKVPKLSLDENDNGGVIGDFDLQGQIINGVGAVVVGGVLLVGVFVVGAISVFAYYAGKWTVLGGIAAVLAVQHFRRSESED